MAEIITEMTKKNSFKRKYLKRNIKDFVFTDLFGIKEFTFELYKALHPEDTLTTEEDIRNITQKSSFVNSEYNDLGFLVRDKLIILVEEQSTWSENILIRMLFYIAETIREYVAEKNLNLYGSAKVSIPTPELYVIYAGDKKTDKETISLKESFFDGKETDIDVRIRIINTTNKSRCNNRADIVNQYLKFAQIENEEVRKTGRTLETLQRIIARCEEDGVLIEYFMRRKGEVFNYFKAAISDEEELRMYENQIRMESHARGLAEGRATGLAEGKTEAYSGIAKNLKSLGYDMPEICKLTGLSEEEAKKFCN